VATLADAPLVAGLLAAYRDHWGSPTTDEAIEAGVPRLIESPEAEFLIAGDPPVGFALLRYRWAIWTGAEDAWLEDLFVEEASRGHGVGRALVEASAERARTRGCCRLQLDTNETNERARRLYQAAGFAEDKMGAGGRDLYLTLRLEPVSD
jgi:GNAT superfamily N-acetyltransferase